MKIASVFSDNMVLQRNRNVRIFGTCTDNEKAITVTLHVFGQDISARAVIKNGSWEAVLPPTKECSSCTLEVSCGAIKKVFNNVAIGEVWLAGGQSNMEFELHNDKNGAKELAECSAENVRYYYTPKCPIESELAEAEKDTGWTLASEKYSQAWSAVGYYFAKELSRILGVTVGVIGCNWGGTSASAWIDRQYLVQDSRLRPYIDEYEAAIKGKSDEEMIAEYDEYCKYQEKWQKNVADCFAEDPCMEWDKVVARCGENRFPGPHGIKNPMRPCGLYETMVKRIAPYTLAGVLWYQGESDDHRPHTYEVLLKALIENWRELWKDCGLPFMIVQLPMFRYDDVPDTKSWAYIREAQENVYLTVRNTGIAYALDCGELNNIHPTDKAPVGHRLYMQAMTEVYGLMSRSMSLPPMYESYEVQGCTMLIKLTNHEKGLGGKNENCLDGFELAGADGVFCPAKAKVALPYIELTCDEVKIPVAARFKWINYADVNLFGVNGLPLPPFRTDKTLN
ncbi:MAG: sialate O-acetylesterase [Ruminococcus sp.]|uniref:sialate O-acetylesterase n=1 Tax=Ruminococcus sp. TaxID=41978 RepID=UPI0025DB3794|nr:sialate O-acetylesterase [Ruminococcus sp.]MCR5600405.1 sialate O-acetylesterase [Ruminococcus sp.]